jgi:hypothetical protein
MLGPIGELLAVAEVFDGELNHVATTALCTGEPIAIDLPGTGRYLFRTRVPGGAEIRRVVDAGQIGSVLDLEFATAPAEPALNETPPSMETTHTENGPLLVSMPGDDTTADHAPPEFFRGCLRDQLPLFSVSCATPT